TASVLVVGASTCPLAVAASLAAFFERESCGQCPPCAVGSRTLWRAMRGLETGEAHARDLRDVAEAAGFMADHGYCAHSRTAAAATLITAGLWLLVRRYGFHGPLSAVCGAFLALTIAYNRARHFRWSRALRPLLALSIVCGVAAVLLATPARARALVAAADLT